MKQEERPGDSIRSADARTPRLKWLLWPLAASALVISVQAWNGADGVQQGAVSTNLSNTLDARLSPTAHPAVPATLDAMWFVPRAPAALPAAMTNLARGVEMLDQNSNPADALPLVSATVLAGTDVEDYARYYTGIALQRLNRLDEADAAFATVAARDVAAQLPEAALYRQAEIRETRNDFAGAAAIYERLLERGVASPQIALVKLGAALSASGNRERAIAAHRRVLREFTLTSEAAEAERLLDSVGGFALDSPAAVQEELGRAEALYKARKYDQARDAFTRVRGRLEGNDQDRATIRLAQIQAANGQYRAARDVLKQFVGHKSLAPEAQFGVIASTRALGEHDEAKSLTEDFVARNPNHPLAEEALNEVARRYVLDDEDGKAAEVYTRMVDRFPSGAHAERAAWKAGWWAYRQKNFQETVRVFERGAAAFPRSDYRPSWLYWTARSYEQMGETSRAVERYRLTITDYLNTYYGRLSSKRLEALHEATVTQGVRRALIAPPAPPANAATITRLIETGLYRPALNELQYAQKVWGDSPALQATIAHVHNKMGNLRLGINAMRRAYPQFMAAGGEELPREILEVIFPLDYWPLLKGNAQAHGLDPFIVVALAAQESTFDAQIRSPANAIGLMQFIPATGRRYAKKLGIRNFSERSLENPEIAARLGTTYIAEMYQRFGGYHFALAGYNAGEHRVAQWNSEAPGLPQDEWIDNIPFFETQNYVKRILGTAEDYRRLYGNGQTPTRVVRPATAPVKKSVAPVRKTTKKATTKKRPTPKKSTAKPTTKKPAAKNAATTKRG
jgi:soluble lytic murein transglycosylase